MKKTHTIKDIARLAGVSKGTVDRVLHNRGKVSKSAFEKIDKVLKEIDYVPNPIARNLKKNKIYRICILMPDPQVDPYWLPANQGIQEARKEFKPFGVSVEEYLYHPFDKPAFIEKSNEILESEPDVILMAPLFPDESIQILQNCKARKIRVALFNNYVDKLNGETFVGQDLYQSGKVAGGLVAKMVGTDVEIAIIHINMEAHMQLKEKGFKAHFEENENNRRTLKTQNFNLGDLVEFETQVASFLDKNPNIAAIFVTNSKAHKVVSALSLIGYDGIVVGYDLLDENIAYLKNGKIDFLIHQNPKNQAYLGIVCFAEFFLFGKKVPTERLLPIDVITAENVQYYCK